MNSRSTSAPFQRSLAPRFPYGIAYVASVLESKYEVSVWDRNVDNREIEAVLKKEQPDVIGLSVMTGLCILDAIAVSQKAKEFFPDVPTVWGGYHPTLLPEQTVAEPYVDFVVCGDGEYTMLELVRSIRSGSPINRVDGICYKKKGKLIKTKPRTPIKNLDDLPFPAWHKFPIEKCMSRTLFNEKEINLNTSRGCPFNCRFCCEPAFHKQRWRANSSRRVIDMVKHLKIKYGCSHISFRDSLFTASFRRVETICDLLIKENVNIHWDCPARVNISKRLLLKMKRAGCTRLEFGVENGSPRLLKLIDKRITLSQVYAAFRNCNLVGIAPQINLIIGLPTETREDLNMTFALLKKVKYERAAIFVYIPFPQTWLYHFAVEREMLTVPKRLRDWVSAVDPSASYVFGEVEKTELLKIVQSVRRGNRLRTLKFAVPRIFQNPTDCLGVLLGFNYRFLQSIKRHNSGDDG